MALILEQQTAERAERTAERRYALERQQRSDEAQLRRDKAQLRRDEAQRRRDDERCCRDEEARKRDETVRLAELEESKAARLQELTLRREEIALQRSSAAAIADKPLAVISNKSDAKITEHRHVVSIKGIFASDASFIATFQVEDQVGIPVPDTAAAFQSFRRLIKTHCQTNTPDLSDAQIKSAMFVQFDAGKSGVSITDFRPKNVTRVSNLAALATAVSLASRVYSDFFGPHIRSGFERLTTDLGDLVRELPGSITLAAAIELVDNAIASLRDAFALARAGDRPATSELDSIAVATMSIPESHCMVQQYLKTSLQANLVASSKSQDSIRADDPTGRRQKKAAPAASGAPIGAAGGASLGKSHNPRPTIAGKFPCFSWASKSGACGALHEGSACTQLTGPHPHAWDLTTSAKDKSAFIQWLQKRKE